MKASNLIVILSDEQTPDDRRFYERAESEARAAKRGLRVDPQPVPVSAVGVASDKTWELIYPRIGGLRRAS